MEDLAMRSILFLLFLCAVGCGGDDTGVTPDAANNLPQCTGVAYDSCMDTTGNTDCMPGMTCRLFMGDGITICTPACDADNPCPNDKDGLTVTCNMMGRCNSRKANECTL